MTIKIISPPVQMESKPIMYKVVCGFCGCKLSFTDSDVRNGSGYHQPERWIPCLHCRTAVSTSTSECFSKTDYANMDKS